LLTVTLLGWWLFAHIGLAAPDLFAALLVAIVVAACASDDDEFFDIGDGRPDASLDTGISNGTGGKPSFDSCQPDFCPVIGPGAPCCITPEGPCGMDTGLGCRTDEQDN